jgi:ribonuclease BN (tRNA processing enzyme)
MSDVSFRIIVNGTDHAFMRELGCNCGRCRIPHLRGNTSVSLAVINHTKTQDELVWHALIDAGVGAINNLWDNFAEYSGEPRVDLILLTHWHPDHTLGLNHLSEGLRRSRRAHGLSEGAIPVWCRLKTLERLQTSHAYELGGSGLLTPYDILPESEQPGVLLSPINTGALGLDASMSIQPLTISHETAGEHSTAGFIIKRESGKRIALLWDLDNLNDAWVVGGGSSDALRALQGVDVLFVDCNTWSAEGRGHITFQRLQDYVKVIRPAETVLIHLSGHEDKHGNPGFGWSNSEWEARARGAWRTDCGLVTVLNPGQIRTL